MNPKLATKVGAPMTMTGLHLADARNCNAAPNPQWWGFVASYYVMPETPDSSAAVVTSDKGDQVQVPSALSGM